MLHHVRSQARSFIEICKVSEIFYKSLTLERCYNTFDDDDDEAFSNRRSNYRNQRPWNSNRLSNDRSNFGNTRSNRYNNRNYFDSQNSRFSPKQSFNSSQTFGEELKDVSFDEDNLVPIEKYLYVEHTDIAQRSDKEIESYRRNLNISVVGSDVPRPIADFQELCLPDALKRVIEIQDYSKPTPIQAQGWPIALSGKDMVGISQTGSGKTLVFMIPAIIHALNQPDLQPSPDECAPQVLVLAPTRELVQQISQVGMKFCKACNLTSGCAYGGASKMVQLRLIQGANICIATPGRLIDFISEGRITMKNCTYLVLDEADRMLDMGFEPQIRKIVGQIRPDRQTLMWSATWPEEIQNLAEDFLNDYVKVTVGEGQLVANPNIEQNIYIVDELDKENRLTSMLKSLCSNNENKILVFAQTKRTVDYLGMTLNRFGIKSMVIHGDVSQTKRDLVLKNFRRMNCVLIATDVAARGLDITDVHHVINYDFPPNIEDYIHRIGRTARGESSGVAHSFLTPENAGIARELITVLKQAKQKISPELYTLSEKRPKFNKGNSMRWSNRQKYQYAY